MGLCCSKFGEYFIGGKDDDGVATNGAGATPKITKLSKKESVKETATSNGDVTIQTGEKNGATATTSVSVTTNGKTIENKDASDETKTTDDIVITHKDTNGGSGGVTVSTGIAPVEHQPNVNVTTDHLEHTSHSKSTPDANTQVEEVVITKSSVLNEPGHTKIIEETTKTTTHTSTVLLNETLIESSDKKKAEEDVTKVNKTVVEVKGAEVVEESKKEEKNEEEENAIYKLF